MARYVILLSICINLFYASFAQNKTELKRAVRLAQEESDTLAISRAWYALGRYYDNKDLYDSTAHSLRDALYWAQAAQSHTATSVVANYLASVFSHHGQPDSAIYYYQKAMDACVMNADSSRLASVLMNLGGEHASIGDFLSAANLSLRAIRIKESMNDSANLSFFYQKLGEVYKLAGENQKWEEYVLKAYQLVGILGCADLNALTSVYNDMGGIAQANKRYSEALLYYDTLLSIGRINQYDKAIGVALRNSASIHKQLGNTFKALGMAKEAQKYPSSSVYHRVNEGNLLAELYLDNGNPSQALRYALATYHDSAIGNFPDEQMHTLKLLYLIEKQNGNFEQALLWNETLKMLSDSLRELNVRKAIVDLEIAYQTEKKDHQIQMLSTINTIYNQRIRYGTMLVVLLLIVLSMGVMLMLQRRSNARMVEANLQQKLSRSQMNPHFVSNALSSIQRFLYSNNAEMAAKYLGKFSLLNRMVLEHSLVDSIPLDDEIEMLSSYLEFEQLRMGNAFSYSIESNQVNAEMIAIPPLLIQPFVENAVKHGMKDRDKNGEIIIKFTDLNQWLKVEVIDNGVGAKNGNVREEGHVSRSAQIVRQRLEFFKRRHKKIPPLQMVANSTDSNKGYHVILHLPIIA